MTFTDEQKKKIENEKEAAKETVRPIPVEDGMALSDEELDHVSGGEATFGPCGPRVL